MVFDKKTAPRPRSCYIFHPITEYKKKITGIDRHESRCDTSAMPAAAEVSSPYAPGTTIVFSPNGIETAQRMQTESASGKGNTASKPTNTIGTTSKRHTDAR